MTTVPTGSSNESELRQRASAKTSTSASTQTSTRKLDAESSRITLIDLLRFVVGIALASTIASYAVTSGKTLTWGITDASKRPKWLSTSYLKAQFSGPLELTNDQLAHYDGSDGSPIYLALNRTIYDVSSSPHVYGPGGPYSQLAAKDASRSYITTCFDPVEDLVPYFGGAEEIFVPLWLSKKTSKKEMDDIAPGEVMNGMYASDLMDQIKTKLGKKNLRTLTEEVYAAAHDRVRATVAQWEGMFEKKGYPVVGKVIGVDEEDPMKWRHLEFCEAAKKQRPELTESMGRAMQLMGKDPSNINIKDMFGGKGAKDATEKSQKSKKKKKSKGKKGDGEEDKKNAKIEDLKAGGKYAESEDRVQEMLKSGPMGGDAGKAKQAVDALKKDKGSDKLEVPEGVPEAVKASL